ncbi:MAG: hypothetical protein AMXMBFR84_15490 [Candidatus Hydrogenedentota bacterium]
MSRFILSVFSLLICAYALGVAWADDAAQFKAHVEPILVGKCITCHGADAKGGLDLRSKDTFEKGGENGAIFVAGDSANSLIVQYVREGKMPPKAPLNAGEIAAIEGWIASGAYFPESPLDPFAATTTKRAGYDWWSLQPLRPVEPPDVSTLAPGSPFAATWNAHPIDQFVFAKLRDAGLEPSGPASPRTLIRRATFDLIGLPPTPEEVSAFLSACEQETGKPGVVGDVAYAELLDRLLASPRYGEHWGRHWLDVVRFGESNGYEVNYIIENVWPYRDYVIQSFNEDKPYDRFVTEQLAGDALEPGNPEIEIATAFLVCGPYDNVGNQDAVQAAQIRANSIDDMIRATSESFLGLTVGCARCHDHKFDPISQTDYYGLYASFAGVWHGERTVATEAQLASRQSVVQPLEAKRDAIAAEQAQLVESVLARAESKAAEYEARWTREKVLRSGTEETFAPVEARYVRMTSEGRDADPNAPWPFKMDEFDVYTAGPNSRNVALAAHGGKVTGVSRKADDFGEAYLVDVVIDGSFGVSWIAQGPELTVELAKPELIDRVLFSSDRPNALGDNPEAVFVCEYRIDVSMDGQTWTEVAHSHDRKPVHDAHRRTRLFRLEATDEEKARVGELGLQLNAAKDAIAAVPALPRFWIGELKQPVEPFYVFAGGDPQRKGERVLASSMKSLSAGEIGFALDEAAPERDRRLALASWIVAKQNPITPRVIVNRLWHYHFGTGIVSTPSDFGFMGSSPTHPELLDWLANELVDPGYGPLTGKEAWRLKRLHRIIMRSQTYRQGSQYREDASRIDGDSRFLWRFPPRRLSSDSIRDSILSIAGKLDTEAMGGPGFRLYAYWRDNVSTYVPLDKHGPETYRRAVYHQHARAERIDLLTDFDSPDCAMPAPARASTTSPLQALTLMNHSFTLDMASYLQERLERESGMSNRVAQVQRAFQLAFARPPSELELTASIVTIEAHGMQAFCRALLNANELMFVD